MKRVLLRNPSHLEVTMEDVVELIGEVLKLVPQGKGSLAESRLLEIKDRLNKSKTKKVEVLVR